MRACDSKCKTKRLCQQAGYSKQPLTSRTIQRHLRCSRQMRHAPPRGLDQRAVPPLPSILIHSLSSCTSFPLSCFVLQTHIFLSPVCLFVVFVQSLVKVYSGAIVRLLGIISISLNLLVLPFVSFQNELLKDLIDTNNAIVNWCMEKLTHSYYVIISWPAYLRKSKQLVWRNFQVVEAAC